MSMDELTLGPLAKNDVDVWIDYASGHDPCLVRWFESDTDARQRIYDFTKGLPLAIARVLALLGERAAPPYELDPVWFRRHAPGIVADVLTRLPLSEADFSILYSLIPFDTPIHRGIVQRETGLGATALAEITARLEEWCVLVANSSNELGLSPFARLALE